jgi:hypothetical protein
MSLQADETPCTILYLIKGQKVDVGKAVITKPLEPKFHGKQIPVVHLRVHLSSVKPGHEDLPPLVLLGGEDDETPPRLGACKGWMLIWPKNLLRLDAAEGTPITTHQQAGMNTTTPPTQIATPVVPSESGGRREEGVDDVIAPVEHAKMDEDEDPLLYIDPAYYDDIDMMSQPYDDSAYQHVDEEMDDVPGQERPSRVDCKKSLFMQSSQDMPEDAGSTQAQLAEGHTVLSLTTLGQG